MFSYNSCTICGDSITDPICRNCYIKQTGILLNDFKINSMANKIILGNIKNKFPIETLSDIECILCKLEDVAVCHYCFSVILIGALRELNFPEKFIENFRENSMYEEISLGN